MLMTSPLAAQLNLPAGQVRLPPVGDTIGDVTDTIGDTLDDTDSIVERKAQQLLRARERSLSRLLRRNRDLIERDARGELARRGEIIAQDLTEAELALLQQARFRLIARETIEGLDFSITRLGTPQGLDLAEAQQAAAEIAPNANISADNLHFQAGTMEPVKTMVPTMVAMQSATPINIEVGIIDGAPGAATRTLGEKGFASGAPKPSDHGSAIASLLWDAGIRRIRVADVYGSDPAGGNALAIAKALGWLTARGSKVVTISLVGPRNRLVERAVQSARLKGIVVVAAVGNDGPAAPPPYPASYPGVVAITGVDRRERALIEAGRALNLDYAAPGADVYGLNVKGKRKRLRGTSFATPLAAARIAAAMERGGNWRAQLDAEARDLGTKGPDKIYGRGLVCAECGRKK
ncbi:S8 family serine peptidase [Alterisphingorhabdus coralli]|uniref:S8 family serine peptidase n=1 Tax=Alterisphingorhabdus coralli TaxID=3071408 RepID=A0AA97I1F8_9SPHN|nr:S8 family serine peptidase [Parasphingorhabdus sp. SCSIO 66989]WOE74690.1 S8 family serine peptidase [Parasphingorhabdus sp. SCSIO 66989]